jgi:hypothetical protein
LFFSRRRNRAAVPQPRILDDEIGVEFEDGEFIPYADLGYSSETGYFRLSETEGVRNEAAPYAAEGRMIDWGQVIVSTGAARRLSNDVIKELLERHAAGDYGEYGEFFDLDVDDDMLLSDAGHIPDPGLANKVNTLTGIEPIMSLYTVDDNRYMVITEAGEKRSTMLLFAGPAREE